MPNFILTEACNKNCKYCFANGSHGNKEEMSVEMAKQLIDRFWDDNEHIQLLGGEPTIAKNFKEIFAYMMELVEDDPDHDVPTLITNLLFDEETLDFICSYVERGVPINMLLNATELDEQNRMETFKRNYFRLMQYNREYMSLGITIDENRSNKYLRNYVRYLLENLPSEKNIRLSAPMPPGNKTVLPFQTKKTGRKIYAVCKELYRQNVTGHFDCALFPCLFTKRQYRFINSFFENRTYCEGADGGPKDIYPDGHVIRCYPGSAIKSKPSNDIDYIVDSVYNRISYLSSNYPVNIPKKCKKCKFYKMTVCDGPCLGCLSCDEEKKKEVESCGGTNTNE